MTSAWRPTLHGRCLMTSRRPVGAVNFHFLFRCNSSRGLYARDAYNREAIVKGFLMLRKWLFGLALVAGAAASPARAGMIADAIDPGASVPPLVQLAQLPFPVDLFLFGGHDYCWYDDGWHGGGWYWCGYAYREGYGYGGGEGFNGWREHRYERDWHGHGDHGDHMGHGDHDHMDHGDHMDHMDHGGEHMDHGGGHMDHGGGHMDHGGGHMDHGGGHMDHGGGGGGGGHGGGGGGGGGHGHDEHHG